MNFKNGDKIRVFTEEEFYSNTKNRIRSDIHPELLKDLNLYGPFYQIVKIDGRYVQAINISNSSEAKLNATFNVDLIKEIVEI